MNTTTTKGDTMNTIQKVQHRFTTGDAVKYTNGFGAEIQFTVSNCTHVDGVAAAYTLLVNGNDVTGYVALDSSLEPA
jgi:hypothetical protein